MTKCIKVWVASTDGATAIIGKNGGLHYVTERNMHKGPDVKHVKRLQSLGWTVEPHTLTRGHGDD